ncbi:MAG TPA: hypothetical protein PK335_11835 [Draconibacterium sp.]|nr:hypothetical protein [Draconibacterium sp.]
MKTKTTARNLLPVISLVVLLAVIGASIYKIRQMNVKLTNQKVKSEILLAEKLSLDKSINKMGQDLSDAKDNNAKLGKKVNDMNTQILAKNSEIDQLKARMINYDALKQRNLDMDRKINELNTENGKLNSALASANSENKKLNNQLQTYAQTNSDLYSDNSIFKAMFSDNFRTEALRGKKDKLTLNARRTNKLSVSFDIPNNVQEKLYFKVITPDGKELSSKNDVTATITIIEPGDELLASTDFKMISSQGKERVELSLCPQRKLLGGIYQFNLYNDDRLLGSTQLKLR